MQENQEFKAIHQNIADTNCVFVGFETSPFALQETLKEKVKEVLPYFNMDELCKYMLNEISQSLFSLRF